MGGVTHSIPSHQWKFVSRTDNFEIYQNQNGDLAQKHVIPNNYRVDEEEQLQSYYYRYATNKPLVKVYRSQYQSTPDFCSNPKNLQVFTQYIPYRLVDTRSLTHEQGLYVLSEALIGFYELYQKLGAFPVDHTLIGFNKDGFAKVWHSPNFAKNHFVSDNIVLMSTQNPHDFDQRILYKQQEEMVQDIWASVDTHATFSADFRQKIVQIQNFNFQTAKDMVDIYIKWSGNIPDRLKFADKNQILQKSRYFGDNSMISNNRNSASGNYDRTNSALNLRRN